MHIRPHYLVREDGESIKKFSMTLEGIGSACAYLGKKAQRDGAVGLWEIWHVERNGSARVVARINMEGFE